jgi:aspartate/methionine/tyrosine aminotransferase
MLNPLAESLNEKIQSESSDAFSMLSALGKRIFFPSKGILSQSAEAKKLAKNFNATIGTALENHKAMHLDCIMNQLSGISPNDALLYAPSSGMAALRQQWKKKLLHDNPTMANFTTSLPVVTNGLSHALSIAGDLFVDAGDTVILPDMNWDNYLLNLGERTQANLQFFSFFANGGFNIAAFEAALDAQPAGKKAFVLLNFPNNPTGYTPLESEGEAIAAALLKTAERGVKLVALIDDAYYGLFYDDASMKQSLFVKIAGKHDNLLAIKADAATKECYVWGLRVGFLTFAVKGATEGGALYSAFEAKAAGLIRATVSSCSELSQYVVCNALANPNFYAERAAKSDLMGKRCREVRAVLDAHPEYAEYFTAYPFNSGYFMCLRILKSSAETLRHLLLEKYGTGGIAITDTNFRLAFSCLEVEQIPQLFANIYSACQELAK